MRKILLLSFLTLVASSTAYAQTSNSNVVGTGNVFKINGATVVSIGTGLAITSGVLAATGSGGNVSST